jgi:hypothetical protein
LAYTIPYKVPKRATPSLALAGTDWGSWAFNFGNWNPAVSGDAVYVNVVGVSVGFVRWADIAIITSEL